MNDPDSIRTFLLMLVLVAFSAYFSATETAFSSLNRIRIKSLADSGNRRAKLVQRLSEEYDRLLSTILVGNNIVNILLASISPIYFVGLYGEGRGTTISTVVSTVVVLIFGEISPKSVAKDHAEGFAMTSAPIIRVISYLLYPVNWLFSQWKRLLGRIFKSPGDTAVTEEELLTIVDEAEQGGSLGEQESDMIRRVIGFNDREAVDILIPRVDVVGVELHATPEQLMQVFRETEYSRLPVYDGTIDDIVGIVHQKNVFRDEGRHPAPADVLTPAVFVPPTMKIRLLLRLLQQEKTHMAVVSDEYGGTLGIVTMEDILEELVGEIWDEHDEVVTSIRPAEDGQSSVLCSMELGDMMSHFGCHTDCEASTVSGWVMASLGKIPAVGDCFTADGLHAVVTRVDANHPEEILVRPVSTDAPDSE